MNPKLKIIVERHEDGYTAYPLGIVGVVVGQGDTYEESIQDLESAIRFHVETFGPGVLQDQADILEAFLAVEEIAL